MGGPTTTTWSSNAAPTSSAACVPATLAGAPSAMAGRPLHARVSSGQIYMTRRHRRRVDQACQQEDHASARARYPCSSVIRGCRTDRPRVFPDAGLLGRMIRGWILCSGVSDQATRLSRTTPANRDVAVQPGSWRPSRAPPVLCPPTSCSPRQVGDHDRIGCVQ